VTLRDTCLHITVTRARVYAVIPKWCHKVSHPHLAGILERYKITDLLTTLARLTAPAGGLYSPLRLPWSKNKQQAGGSK